MSYETVRISELAKELRLPSKEVVENSQQLELLVKLIQVLLLRTD